MGLHVTKQQFTKMCLSIHGLTDKGAIFQHLPITNEAAEGNVHTTDCGRGRYRTSSGDQFMLLRLTAIWRLNFLSHVSFQIIANLYVIQLTILSFPFSCPDRNTFTGFIFFLTSLRQLMQHYKPLGVNMIMKKDNYAVIIVSSRLGFSKLYLYPNRVQYEESNCLKYIHVIESNLKTQEPS